MLGGLAFSVVCTVYILFGLVWLGFCLICPISVAGLGTFLQFLVKSDRSPRNRYESHERCVTVGFPAYENIGVQVCRSIGRDLVEGHTGEATCAAMLKLGALQKYIVDTGVS